MKHSGKVSVLTVLSVLSMAGSTFAMDVADVVLTTTGAVVGGTAGAALSTAGTTIDLSETLGNAKEAVVNAAPDAAKVLQGAHATDAFENGKAGAEKLLNTKFESDADAAVAILELAEASAQ